MDKISVSRKTLTNIIWAKLGEARCFVARGNDIRALDEVAFTEETVDAIVAQAKFDEPEPRFDPDNEDHVALSLLRDFVSVRVDVGGDTKPGLLKDRREALEAVDLLIKKAGMR